jgi:hypothetical protein
MSKEEQFLLICHVLYINPTAFQIIVKEDFITKSLFDEEPFVKHRDNYAALLNMWGHQI